MFGYLEKVDAAIAGKVGAPIRTVSVLVGNFALASALVLLGALLQIPVCFAGGGVLGDQLNWISMLVNTALWVALVRWAWRLADAESETPLPFEVVWRAFLYRVIFVLFVRVPAESGH